MLFTHLGAAHNTAPGILMLSNSTHNRFRDGLAVNHQHTTLASGEQYYALQRGTSSSSNAGPRPQAQLVNKCRVTAVKLRVSCRLLMKIGIPHTTRTALDGAIPAGSTPHQSSTFSSPLDSNGQSHFRAVSAKPLRESCIEDDFRGPHSFKICIISETVGQGAA
ncbi:hypothetical protein OE88DRAFT_1317067 [Heliocybe sulcata]|uniref:Uncharacterized protein n=1 Tax=Heliocybe sulcata TaxID=5364 RepID=A0A5C3N6T7_9AGAM|nr:hypothetical protein OE88DRAFT_1317067 [Heliocybe sulcata]